MGQVKFYAAPPLVFSRRTDFADGMNAKGGGQLTTQGDEALACSYLHKMLSSTLGRMATLHKFLSIWLILGR